MVPEDDPAGREVDACRHGRGGAEDGDGSGLEAGLDEVLLLGGEGCSVWGAEVGGGEWSSMWGVQEG